MRKHTPSLFPWVNQCGDGTEWLARAGTPYAVPELYSVAGTSGNATAMAMAQLGGYDSWIGESQRFGKLKIKLHVHCFAELRRGIPAMLVGTGLTHWPLVGIGDGGSIHDINSSSLARFQAYSAVAYVSRRSSRDAVS